MIITFIKFEPGQASNGGAGKSFRFQLSAAEAFLDYTAAGSQCGFWLLCTLLCSVQAACAVAQSVSLL